MNQKKIGDADPLYPKVLGLRLSCGEFRLPLSLGFSKDGQGESISARSHVSPPPPPFVCQLVCVCVYYAFYVPSTPNPGRLA